jgi:membrane protease YdiL (CAAX protease family)
MIVVVAILGIFIFGTVISAVLIVTHLRVPTSSPAVLRVMLLAQFLSYVVVLLFMHVLVVRHYHRRFGDAVHWQWPRNRRWLAFLLGGMALAILVQLVSVLLPIPKTLPIDKYFQSRSAAYIMSIFGISMAPLVEELFFRGFLYPAGVRWTARVFSVPSLTRLALVGSLLTLSAGALGCLIHPRWEWVIVIFFFASVVLFSVAKDVGLLPAKSKPILAAAASVIGSIAILRMDALSHTVQSGWQWLITILFFVSIMLYSATRPPELLRDEYELVVAPASIVGSWFLVSRIAPPSLFWPVSALVAAFLLVNVLSVNRPLTDRRALESGLTFAVVGTALGFALVHASQLASAWAPLLVLFAVGLVFTIVRVVTRNVAPGFLMHVGYNFMLFAMLYFATDHFRHMEKMLQQ